jgi:hypothetical protein
MNKFSRRLLAATVLATALVGLLVSPASAHDGGGLAAVRRATAAFHDTEDANAAGYFAFLPCFDKPGVGGMGQHLVNKSLLDGVINATQPEALVYEVNGDQLTLVAVEYIVPFGAWGSTPPTLFGQSFHRNETLGLWALHAWIWRHNPLGMFADYNPRVDMCPGGGESD